MELHIFIRKNKQECEGNQTSIRKNRLFFGGSKFYISGIYIYIHTHIQWMTAEMDEGEEKRI